MKQLAAFVAGVVVTGAIVVLGPGTAGSNARGVAKPQCAKGELTMIMTSVRAGSAKGRTAEDAVRKEVTGEFPSLAPERLRKSSSGSKRVDFALERGGRPLASIQVEKIGSGWGVERLTVCNSVLTGASK